MEYFDRIESYAEKRMTAEERVAFEADLSVNAELRAEHDAYLASQKVLQMLAFDELGEINLDEGRQAKVIPFWKKYTVAAAAAAIVLGMGLLWFAQANFGDEALADEFYSTPNVSDNRAPGKRILLDDAHDAFIQEKYTEVISLVGNVPANDINYAKFQFILGHAFLKKGNPENAAAAFKKTIDASGFQNLENARWHLALSLLAAGKEIKAIELLKDISQNGTGGYPARADELLAKLKSGWRFLIFK